MMVMRRFTRLANAFSKKAENHAYAVALHFMHYNYCRIHQTLRITPAMAANLVASPWTVDDIVALVEKAEAEAAPNKARTLQATQKRYLKVTHYRLFLSAAVQNRQIIA
jgi:hypothetical protein